MGYSKTITVRAEGLYGSYFDQITALPPGESIQFAFPSISQCEKTEFNIRNWLRINQYTDYYKVLTTDDKKHLLIVDLDVRTARLPTPAEVRHLLETCPTEAMFETAKYIINAFNLLRPEELAQIEWKDKEETEHIEVPTLRELKQESAYDDVW